MLEIGEKPVGSCQNYAHGSHNDCLLGYTDPDTKILVLRNAKGKIIARSIFRLLEDEQGNPAPHIERVYSSVASKGVMRSLFTHASRKAEALGTPLYTSEESQNEQGDEVETQIPQEFMTIPHTGELTSHTSRAPKVYVDSAGGARSRGEYKIPKIVEIKENVG